MSNPFSLIACVALSLSVMAFFPIPERYQSKISRTIRASSSTITNFPPIIRYPYGAELGRKVPFCIRFWHDQRWFWEMEMDSCCALTPDRASIVSLASLSVRMFSFSNHTVTPSCRSSRSASRNSMVLRANREVDFTRIRSICPFRQSAIRRLNSSRLSIRVPVSPSSA